MGYQWSVNGGKDADPELGGTVLGHLQLRRGRETELRAPRAPSGGQLNIQSDGTVPQPSKQPTSLGITVNGRPVTVVGTGPNLNQTFRTHPTYYIDARNYIPGLIVDTSILTGFKPITYAGGATDAAWELLPDNT